MKKLISCLLTLFLLLCPTSLAEEEREVRKSGDYTYVLLADGTAEITKYSGFDKVLEIPSELDGFKVTSIGNQAFSGCRSLTAVTIPDSVTSIGNDAFYYCSSLTAITIPDSVASIGVNPFVYCKKLSEINVSLEHPYLATIDGVLFSKPDMRLICYPCAFEATEYAIPQGIQSIGDRAFYDCSSLTAVTIADSVNEIGEGAFASCSKLASVQLPQGLTVIEAETFSGCALENVIIPESVTRIGEEAFYSNEKLASIVIPNGLIEIGDSAFRYCGSLKSISLPEGLSFLGESAFYKCKSLKEVTVPGDIKNVKWETFAYSGIERLILQDGITALDELAIDYCDNLSYIVLPSTLETMASDAIYACDSLKVIEIPASLREVGGNPFSCCMGLTEIIVSPDNPYFETVDGILYGIEDQSLVCYPCSRPGNEVIIRDGTVRIHESAFSWALNVETVQIPESLKSIGNYAFQGCLNLETANLPTSVDRIGDLVFLKCPKLVLMVEKDSYAAMYCEKEGIPYNVQQ